VSERVIDAISRSITLTRVPRPDLKLKARRRNAKDLFEEGRKGTYLATSDAALAAARSKDDAKQEAKRVKTLKSEAAEAAKKLKLEAEQEKATRLERLQEALPSVDLAPHMRSVGRYLSQSKPENTLEWAIAIVQKRLTPK
jgi:hypothetical protein